MTMSVKFQKEHIKKGLNDSSSSHMISNVWRTDWSLSLYPVFPFAKALKYFYFAFLLRCIVFSYNTWEPVVYGQICCIAFARYFKISWQKQFRAMVGNMISEWLLHWMSFFCHMKLYFLSSRIHCELSSYGNEMHEVFKFFKFFKCSI